MKKLSVLGIGLALLTNCAVEAGNPTGSKGKLTISFAQVTDDVGTFFELDAVSTFQMNVQGLQVNGYSESEELIQEVPLGDATVDLLATGDDDLVPFVTAAEIEPGVYEDIVLTLNQEAPLRYTKRDGTQESIETIQFSDASYTSFTVSDVFEVEEDGLTEVIINLDAFNSIRKGDDNKFKFHPKADIQRRKRGVRYEGVYEGDDGDVVCAYLYNEKLAPKPSYDRPPKGENPPPPPGGEGPMPPPGPKAERRPSFPTKEDVVKDETKDCPNGFDRTRVNSDGEFRFRILKPGSYDFRLFKLDKSFEDLAEGVELSPPEPKGSKESLFRYGEAGDRFNRDRR